MERKKRKVCTVGITYLPIVGDLPNLYKVVHESPLDFLGRKSLNLGDKISSNSFLLRINSSLSRINPFEGKNGF